MEGRRDLAFVIIRAHRAVSVSRCPAVPLSRCLAAVPLSLLMGLALSYSASAGPLSPTEALDAFQLADPQLVIEAVATEPDVIDPVAMAFDEDARLYVVEMRGFQLGPDGKGVPGLCRVRRLEDRDADGRYEHSIVFVDGLFYATAVMPAYGGVIVGCAPNVLFFKDTDGDGRPDISRVLFTGFGTGNHERLINSFQWTLENWVRGCAGGNGGDIRPADVPDAEPVSVNGRDFRLRALPPGQAPALEIGEPGLIQPGLIQPGLVQPGLVQPGLIQPRLGDDNKQPPINPYARLTWLLEPTSGGGQFGLTADDFGRWFTCNNSNHLQHIVLDERYLRRNPYLARTQVLHNVPDHGAAARIYRISPVEEWREVRTRQRAASPDAARFPPTELVPGGYVTAACGLTFYHGDALPEPYYGTTFVCDASNNLLHRDRLEPDGVTFIARRIEQDVDFLASADNWFRPVTAANGPDGAVYVVDMYREIIETPASIPPDILKTIDMEAGNDKGRIWRIRPKAAGPRERPLKLSTTPSIKLVELLGHRNGWTRMTAQRLLVERYDHDAPVLAALRTMLRDDDNPLARLHALCTLAGLDALDDETLVSALHDQDAGVREIALRFAEHAKEIASVRETIAALSDDPSPRVRLQLAFTAGAFTDRDAILIPLAERDAADPWARTALLSSLGDSAPRFWRSLHERAHAERNPIAFFNEPSEGKSALVRELLAVVAASGDPAHVAGALNPIVGDASYRATWWREAALAGMRDGIERSGAGKRLLQGGDEPAHDVQERLLTLMHDADPRVRVAAHALGAELTWPASPELTKQHELDAKLATDPNPPPNERISAIAFLSRGPLDLVQKPLLYLLHPEESPDVQKAAVQSLAATGDLRAAEALLDADRMLSYTPAIRDAAIDAVPSRSAYLPVLLDAIERGGVPSWAIDATRRRRLLEHKDESIRAKAARLLQTPTDADRQAVYDRYLKALQLEGDPARGKSVFKENCAVCHRLEDVGSVVGPDLKGVRDRDPAALLTDVLIPSQAITAGYVAYLVETADGEWLTGLIAGESAAAVTLRQQEGKERTILRGNIQSLSASTVSMMPENLEETITPQQMNDLIAYLKAVK